MKKITKNKECKVKRPCRNRPRCKHIEMLVKRSVSLVKDRETGLFTNIFNVVFLCTVVFSCIAFFHCGLFPLWSFSIVVFSHCGLFQLWSFSIMVFFHCGLFPLWSFSIVVFFMMDPIKDHFWLKACNHFPKIYKTSSKVLIIQS